MRKMRGAVLGGMSKNGCGGGLGAARGRTTRYSRWRRHEGIGGAWDPSSTHRGVDRWRARGEMRLCRVRNDVGWASAAGARRPRAVHDPPGPLRADHVGGLRTFLRLLDLELHFLTLGEGPEAFADDRGEVDEHVVPIRPANEAVALRVVEPLHGPSHRRTSRRSHGLQPSDLTLGAGESGAQAGAGASLLLA